MQYEKNNSVIIIELEERIIKISPNDVLFIETSGDHRVKLHMNEEIVEIHSTLKHMEDISEFYNRCHNSYIVNVNMIKEIDMKNRYVIFYNGEQCEVSHRRLKPLLKEFRGNSY